MNNMTFQVESPHFPGKKIPLRLNNRLSQENNRSLSESVLLLADNYAEQFVSTTGEHLSFEGYTRQVQKQYDLMSENHMRHLLNIRHHQDVAIIAGEGKKGAIERSRKYVEDVKKLGVYGLLNPQRLVEQ